MRFSEFINSFAPIEGIPLDVYKSCYYESIKVCRHLGFQCSYNDGNDTYSADVKCVREYYTDDPDKTKKIGAKDCEKILRFLFTKQEAYRIYPNCLTCHTECLKKKEKGELFFLDPPKKASKKKKRRRNND